MKYVSEEERRKFFLEIMNDIKKIIEKVFIDYYLLL